MVFVQVCRAKTAAVTLVGPVIQVGIIAAEVLTGDLFYLRELTGAFEIVQELAYMYRQVFDR